MGVVDVGRAFEDRLVKLLKAGLWDVNGLILEYVFHDHAVFDQLVVSYEELPASLVGDPHVVLESLGFQVLVARKVHTLRGKVT